jgi:hypothetical protein
MFFPKVVLALAVGSGTLLAAASQAHAFSFVTNDFDVNPLTQSSAFKGDIFLESIKVLDEDGSVSEIVSDFSYISLANIVSNDEFTGGNTGAASADIGDRATTGLKVEKATDFDIATNLRTNNLNNIIDTEDRGSFQIDLHFEKLIDNLLIWERGQNSKLGVQALDSEGNLIGERLVLNSRNWDYAGFKIDTQEIGSAQQVGSLGINISKDLGVEGGISSVRFFSESNFNGPDWKFVGTDANRGQDSADVPEPTFILGLGLFGSMLMLNKRPKAA